MPAKMERRLKREARAKFPGDRDRQNRYVYGTLRKTGWKPSHERKTRSHDKWNHGTGKHEKTWTTPL